MVQTETLEDFYNHKLNRLPDNLGAGLGHFNIFNLEDFVARYADCTPYNRKDFFKISLIVGKNRVHYADKTVEIEKQALFFANPQIPYNWEYLGNEQSGVFCIFTEAFFNGFGNIKDYPVFKTGGNPILFLNDKELKQIKAIFTKMHAEIESDYVYKYDSIRTLIFELIHTALKIQPPELPANNQNASARISSVFIELLERQFPVESSVQKIQLRTPAGFADQLSVHINHLNRAVKEVTGKTTSQVIAGRLIQEAKALLMHTDRNISEIGYSLGFEELPNFINFFRKHTKLSPGSFRETAV